MSDAPSSMSLLVARTWWIMFGPLFLFVFLVSIIAKGGGWTTPADLAYGIGLVGMILARWYEFSKGDPRSSTGEPSTRSELYRYSVIVLATGTAVWMLANLIGNHLIAR